MVQTWYKNGTNMVEQMNEANGKKWFEVDHCFYFSDHEGSHRKTQYQGSQLKGANQNAWPMIYTLPSPP